MQKFINIIEGFVAIDSNDRVFSKIKDAKATPGPQLE